MKVLQISNFHYLRGGADKVYFDTAELLEENGHSVSFFSSKHTDNQSTPFEKYFVEPVDYFGKKTVGSKISSAIRYFHFNQAADNLDQLLKDHKPDIAHLHIFQGQLSNAILPVLKKHKVPVVMSVHEYKMLCPVYTFLDIKGEVCEKCAGGKYYNCFTKKCNKGQTGFSAFAALESYYRDWFIPYEKYIDHFLMVSQSIRNKHIQYKPKFEQQSSCLYNFLDIHQYEPRYQKENYYLYFGRLSREKGVKTLLEAFQKFPDLNLKIVGDGPLKPEFEEACKKSGLTNVELLGFKSGKELTDIIAGAKFSIVPSEWYETFGLIIIEAMALGTPVIGATIGAIPELIENNYNGFLFESKNSDDLCKVIKASQEITSDQYEQMTQNARSFVEENFTKEKHYEKLIEKYNQVIENHQNS